MTTKSKQLVRAGHELASELKADCGAVDMRSVANLLTELASALDVQSARSDALAAELKQSKIDAECYKHGMEQSNKRLTEIAAENAALIGFDADEFSYNGPYQPDDAVLEKLKTPATDAWVNEQQAKGVEKLALHMEFNGYSSEAAGAMEYAAQLRGGQI
ncbi:hypothetical protein PO472_20940 [Atlantibacter hermannii]|uniref:hypothetical protein n=1 Tax=Atlantibacter hermannii TaxID=565 RepID=UPI002FFB55D4